MSALRGLQDKIRQLETERSAAERNLKTLATETSRFRDILHTEPDISMSSHQPANLTQQNQEVYEKLDTTEQRCHLLERQLNHMQKMVHGAEHEKAHAQTRADILREKAELEADEYDVRRRLDKIADLEREHLKMTASQAIAEVNN